MDSPTLKNEKKSSGVGQSGTAGQERGGKKWGRLENATAEILDDRRGLTASRDHQNVRICCWGNCCRARGRGGGAEVVYKRGLLQLNGT